MPVRNLSVQNVNGNHVMDALSSFNVYYWEYQGVMTCAFKWQKLNYGLSFLLEPDRKENWLNRRKLERTVKDTLNVLLCHGKTILDKDGNINWKELNSKEATHYWLDPKWAGKVKAVTNAIKVKTITYERAKTLQLL